MNLLVEKLKKKTRIFRVSKLSEQELEEFRLERFERKVAKELGGPRHGWDTWLYKKR